MERRRQPPPADAAGYLQQLPALALLDRLPIAMLGAGDDGGIVYANPAYAEMLGYADGDTVARLQLPDILTGHETRTAEQCLDTLRSAASPVDWNHEEGYVIRTSLSPPLLLRHTDTLLLVGVTDITAWLWETKTG